MCSGPANLVSSKNTNVLSNSPCQDVLWLQFSPGPGGGPCPPGNCSLFCRTVDHKRHPVFPGILEESPAGANEDLVVPVRQTFWPADGVLDVEVGIVVVPTDFPYDSRLMKKPPRCHPEQSEGSAFCLFSTRNNRCFAPLDRYPFHQPDRLGFQPFIER
jgi:hypothetical protein